ncbi:MAG TPA: bifunctional riboflavin kinase/FAD synthetase [Geminicoccaceae bacterium]|nr:bifunctional riboflavin kinase/FAD synthetase [Geminicoccaceae bacterium]
MRVHRSYRGLPPEARGAVVAIGNFDGVHRGHRAVVGAAGERAARLGARLGVVTFEPHPREVLTPEAAPARLTPLRAKALLLGRLGVAELFVLPFTAALMRKSPEAFVGEVLVAGLGARHVVVGDDFRFGHRRAGDVALLETLGFRHGFGVTGMAPVAWRGETCSSSRIREALAAGEVADAAELLGHPHAVEGRVVRGDGRGRTLGFPTANVRPGHPRALLPATGIYAVRAGLVRRGGDGPAWLDGAASLGWNPTFEARELRLEVHLFDFVGDLYGQRLCVTFVARLRGERRFDDVDDLRRQIEQDCRRARDLLAGADRWS